MVKYIDSDLDSVFSALADKTRRGILADLARGSASASDLAQPHQMSLPAISKHLKILERAKLIDREVQGRTHKFHLQAERFNTATSWIEDQQLFWEMSIEKLGIFLQQDSGEVDD